MRIRKASAIGRSIVRRPESGNLPGSHGHAPPRRRVVADRGAVRPRFRARPFAEAGRFDASANDAVIEQLFTALLPGALAALAAATSADTLARPVRTLPPVEVAAARERLDARRRLPTAAVTDVDARARAAALSGVGELLATTAGARVVDYGGLGAFSTISLRGASPAQVRVYLDGVPLASAANGVVNLADLPAGALDRIEVWRGRAPLAFGADAPGGAVNLVTIGSPAVRELHVAHGSFGTWEARGSAGATHGPLSLLAHAGYSGTRGDFEFRNDNATPFNTADDVDATRINDRSDANDGLLRLGWAIAPLWRASLRGETFHRAQGVPGLAASQAPNPRLASARDLVAVELERVAAPATPGAVVRAWSKREATTFRDPEGELHLGRFDGTSRFRDRQAALALRSPAGWRWVTAEIGGDLRAETAEPVAPSIGQAIPAESRRTTRGCFATLQLHAWDDRALLHAARRWDRQEDHIRGTLTFGAPFANDAVRELDSPQLGARVRLPRGLEARGNWSRATRAPAFGEIFGDYAYVAPNLRLEPERSESWDAALAWSGDVPGGRVNAGWTRHASHVRDLIGWTPAQGRTFRASNLSRAEIRGEELELACAWPALTLGATRAWTSALQTDPGNIYYGRRLPLRPSHQASLWLDARRGAWRARADVVDLGDDYRDPINFNRLPGRTIVGASLSRALGVTTWTLEGRNLGDRRVSDVAGYPLPGRSVYVACDVRFAPANAARP